LVTVVVLVTAKSCAIVNASALSAVIHEVEQTLDDPGGQRIDA
jgi:hypothetical protein